MTHTIEQLFTPITAAMVAMLSGITATAQYLAVGWVDPNVITFTTLTGAIGGSFVSIIFFPPKVPADQCTANTTRVLALKFLASGIFSLILSPKATHWFFGNEPTAQDYLFTSGVIGLCAHTIATLIRRAVKARGEKYTNEKD